MEKTARLINLMVIFILLISVAILAGTIGLIFFEIRYWKSILFNN